MPRSVRDQLRPPNPAPGGRWASCRALSAQSLPPGRSAAVRGRRLPRPGSYQGEAVGAAPTMVGARRILDIIYIYAHTQVLRA